MKECIKSERHKRDEAKLVGSSEIGAENFSNYWIISSYSIYKIKMVKFFLICSMQLVYKFLLPEFDAIWCSLWSYRFEIVQTKYWSTGYYVIKVVPSIFMCLPLLLFTQLIARILIMLQFFCALISFLVGELRMDDKFAVRIKIFIFIGVFIAKFYGQ